MRFTFLKKPTPGCQQRFFKGEDGAVYACDNSGRNPNETDDGPLRMTGKAHIGVGERHRQPILWIVAEVLVLNSDDNDVSRCCLSIKDLVWLLKEKIITEVTWSDNAMDLHELSVKLMHLADTQSTQLSPVSPKPLGDL